MKKNWVPVTKQTLPIIYEPRNAATPSYSIPICLSYLPDVFVHSKHGWFSVSTAALCFARIWKDLFIYLHRVNFESLDGRLACPIVDTILHFACKGDIYLLRAFLVILHRLIWIFCIVTMIQSQPLVKNLCVHTFWIEVTWYLSIIGCKMTATCEYIGSSHNSKVAKLTNLNQPVVHKICLAGPHFAVALLFKVSLCILTA